MKHFSLYQVSDNLARNHKKRMEILPVSLFLLNSIYFSLFLFSYTVAYYVIIENFIHTWGLL